MGCNASQEPIIVPNENGNATMVDAAAEGDDDNGKPPQSLSHQGQQQQQSNQSEPEVSATNNDPNVRPSPGNKTMMMTPQSVGPPMAEHEDAELAEEGFVGNKNTPSSPPVDNEVGSEAAEDEELQMVQSRAQSSATKTISSSSAGSARSSARSVVAEEQQQGNHRGLNSGGEKKESVTANRLEICSDGASDLANHLPNSITETNANGTSTIELSEFGTEEGTRLALNVFFAPYPIPILFFHAI